MIRGTVHQLLVGLVDQQTTNPRSDIQIFHILYAYCHAGCSSVGRCSGMNNERQGS